MTIKKVLAQQTCGFVTCPSNKSALAVWREMMVKGYLYAAVIEPNGACSGLITLAQITNYCRETGQIVRIGDENDVVSGTIEDLRMAVESNRGSRTEKAPKLVARSDPFAGPPCVEAENR